MLGVEEKDRQERGGTMTGKGRELADMNGEKEGRFTVCAGDQVEGWMSVRRERGILQLV